MHQPTRHRIRDYTGSLAYHHTNSYMPSGGPTNNPILQILLQLLFNLPLLPNPNLRNNLDPRSALRADFVKHCETSGNVRRARKTLEEDAYGAGVFDGLGGALAAEGEHLRKSINEEECKGGGGGYSVSSIADEEHFMVDSGFEGFVDQQRPAGYVVGESVVD